MSTASRTWKAVKAHVPLIKFRKGGNTNRSHAETSVPSKAPPVGSTPRGTGIDEALLPKRYLRKPITSLEMDIIGRGGPDKL